MSMNIYIEASRNATVVVKGKKKKIKDSIDFSCFQTPAAITKEILRTGNVNLKVDAYIKWVDSLNIKDDHVKVFSEYDLLENGEPIRVDIQNDGKHHINELRKFLQMCDDEDYDVRFYTL